MGWKPQWRRVESTKLQEASKVWSRSAGWSPSTAYSPGQLDLMIVPLTMKICASAVAIGIPVTVSPGNVSSMPSTPPSSESSSASSMQMLGGGGRLAPGVEWINKDPAGREQTL